MRFGGLVAVDSVNLNVSRGEIMGLIGPNGAGKTTFFNCLTGLYLPTAGSVIFEGALLPPKPRKVVIAGMARTFQNIRLFGNMTALEKRDGRPLLPYQHRAAHIDPSRTEVPSR
jgi:branched-chain amino acid transport system ATP-binding protein